MMHSNPSTL